MSTLKLENLYLDYNKLPLLDNASLSIDKGEKICLVGRNGTGKSSLLNIINGQITPDAGKIWKDNNVKISKLDQDLPEDSNISIFEYVATGLSDVSESLNQYHKLLAMPPEHHDDKWSSMLDSLQKKIEQENGWEIDNKINKALSTLDLDPNDKLSNLSGGWKRKVAIAKALVSSPDILLLDEPSNHLDLESIYWLEKMLIDFPGSIICISHDRTLVDNIATRIVELDRGTLTSYPGNFEQYLKLKAKKLQDEEKQNKEYDKKLAQEEAWIRQGIKARRTRNEGRVRNLVAMRQERAKRREQISKPNFQISKSSLSGRLVAKAKNISFNYNGENNIISNFSATIIRGDKIGVIGPNGSGKSTLLKLMLGELSPSSGNVQTGTNLEIAYFDQLKETIDEELTAAENVGGGRSTIEVNGKSKHIISYLSDYLFTPDKARAYVKKLSGGEKNRLLLAKLFSMPSNIIVLDEPTNDLDIESLELLEELLINYDGTVIIVSHDRKFMDNVITQLYAFEREGKFNEYIGSYSDWIAHKKNNIDENALTSENNGVNNKKASTTPDSNDKIVARIEMLEEKAQKLRNEVGSPDFYSNPEHIVKQTLKKLEKLEKELESEYNKL